MIYFQVEKLARVLCLVMLLPYQNKKVSPVNECLFISNSQPTLFLCMRERARRMSHCWKKSLPSPFWLWYKYRINTLLYWALLVVCTDLNRLILDQLDKFQQWDAQPDGLGEKGLSHWPLCLWHQLVSSTLISLQKLSHQGVSEQLGGSLALTQGYPITVTRQAPSELVYKDWHLST